MRPRHMRGATPALALLLPIALAIALANADTALPSAANLRRRVTLLRARLRTNSAYRQTLERRRAQFESSIAARRARIDELRDAPANGNDAGSDPSENARDTQVSEKALTSLVQKESELKQALAELAIEANHLVAAKNDALDRLQTTSLETIIERHSRGLPPAMQGALRKSALVLNPFFDTLFTAADTNNRLVNHVGTEIDKYAHVNIRGSPFMSGMLFYCVLLIPALTLLLLVRTVIDSSTKWSVSHVIIFGNIYLMAVCAILVMGSLVQKDPMKILHARHESFMVVTNLVLALYYVWFLSILGLQTVKSWEKRNLAQFVAASSIGIHYFLFAWRRMFTDQKPQLFAHDYLIYATIFGFITYDRCLRINARWFTECALLCRIRATDTRISLAPIANLNVRRARQHFAALSQYISGVVQSIGPRLWMKRRSRRANGKADNARLSPESLSPSPSARGTGTTGICVNTATTRNRRCSLFGRTDVEAGTSDASSLCSDSDEGESTAVSAALLSRAVGGLGGVGRLKPNPSTVLAARSRSRNGSRCGDTTGGADGRSRGAGSQRSRWWWTEPLDMDDTGGGGSNRHEAPMANGSGADWTGWQSAGRLLGLGWKSGGKEVKWSDKRNSRGRPSGHRTRSERSNARPRREREKYSMWS